MHSLKEIFFIHTIYAFYVTSGGSVLFLRKVLVSILWGHKHSIALEEETSTNTWGERYSGEEGPIRKGEGTYKNKNSWQLLGPDYIYWKGFHEGCPQGYQASLYKDNLPRQLLMAMHHTTVDTKSGNWFQLQSLAGLCLFPGATRGFQV